MRRSIRIEVGQGYYPNVGLVIDVDGEDYVIESTTPDPDALWRIDTIIRHATPLSVIAHLRRATEEESAHSAAQEKRDTDEWIKTVMR